MGRHFRDHADVLLVGEPADLLDLAELFRLFQPLPQVVIGQKRRGIRAGRARSSVAERRRHGIGHEVLGVRQKILFRHKLHPCFAPPRNAYNAKELACDHPIMPEDAGSNLLHDWIARAARAAPEKLWVVAADDGRTVSYGQLRETVGRFATFLRQRGLQPNDRVALLANNSIEQLLCYFGVMANGATLCTIHVEMNRNQLENIVERLKPRLILYQDGLHLDDLLAGTSTPRLRIGRSDHAEPDTLFAALARCAPSDPAQAAQPGDDAVILFTSGTSAQPKGVVLNFHEYLLNIDPLAAAWGITADDRFYDFRPFSWNSAQTLGALTIVNRGAILVLAEKFSASRFFRHVRDHGVTIAAGNPTTIHILLNSAQTAHRHNLPKLRFVTSSSAPLLVAEW